jgi:hypothetical protein
VYVGCRCPGLAASPFANPFALKGQLGRSHPLRGYLKAAGVAVDAVTPELLAGTDLITPPGPAAAAEAYRLWPPAVRRWRHRHGRTWLGGTSPAGAPARGAGAAGLLPRRGLAARDCRRLTIPRRPGQQLDQVVSAARPAPGNPPARPQEIRSPPGGAGTG